MKQKPRKPEPCQCDNCRAVTPNWGTVSISMKMCQEHLRGLALETHYLYVEVREVTRTVGQ